MPPTSKKITKGSNGATLGFEAKLWAAADARATTWTRPSTSTSFSA